MDVGDTGLGESEGRLGGCVEPIDAYHINGPTKETQWRWQRQMGTTLLQKLLVPDRMWHGLVARVKEGIPGKASGPAHYWPAARDSSKRRRMVVFGWPSIFEI